jgi:hypothetical protein
MQTVKITWLWDSYRSRSDIMCLLIRVACVLYWYIFGQRYWSAMAFLAQYSPPPACANILFVEPAMSSTDDTVQ